MRINSLKKTIPKKTINTNLQNLQNLQNVKNTQNREIANLESLSDPLKEKIIKARKLLHLLDKDKNINTDKFENRYYELLKEEPKMFYDYSRALELSGWSEGVDIVTPTLDVLTKYGLNESSEILDVGCGCLQLGIPLIEKVGIDRYYAVDMNVNLILAGKKRLEELGKQNMVKYIVSDSFEFEKLKSDGFQYILAHEIVTHMPNRQVQLLIGKISTSLSKDGQAFVTFTEGKNDIQIFDGIFKHEYIYFKRLAEQYGLDIERVEYNHPYGRSMIRLKKKYDNFAESRKNSQVRHHR